MKTYEEVASLVVLSQAGDRNAFGAICQEYQAAITAIALRYTKNHADAEDVAADVFIKALQKIKTANPTCFSAWIKRLAVNQSIDCINSRRLATNVDDSAFASLAAPEVVIDYKSATSVIESLTPDEVSEPRNVARRQLGKLTPLELHTLTERFLNGKSIKQIAAEENVPVGTVKSRIFNAKSKAAEFAAA